jgi:hypothetical protein
VLSNLFGDAFLGVRVLFAADGEVVLPQSDSDLACHEVVHAVLLRGNVRSLLWLS